jgi:hypothetical protein
LYQLLCKESIKGNYNIRIVYAFITPRIAALYCSLLKRALRAQSGSAHCHRPKRSTEATRSESASGVWLFAFQHCLSKVSASLIQYAGDQFQHPKRQQGVGGHYHRALRQVSKLEQM